MVIQEGKLHVAPYGVRPVPSKDRKSCLYQVHNIDTGEDVHIPVSKAEAFKRARDLNDEWKKQERAG